MAFDRSSDADEQQEQKALKPVGHWGRFLCRLRLRQAVVNEHPANFHSALLASAARSNVTLLSLVRPTYTTEHLRPSLRNAPRSFCL
jgi:hypothetical protein